ncbi:hypothetical protein HET73_07160, partial [Wolbachia endosymbiont of Atemnus politus]|nr:hypothetical protein [Wolbachia endosymbiont of Atemnus politus]
PNIRDIKGKTPLDYAATIGDLQSANILLEYEAASNIKDKKVLSRVKRLLATNGKEHLFQSKTLWDNLIPGQQKKLKTFLHWVDKAQNMSQLEQVVVKAIEFGVRFNFSSQGGKVHGNKRSFTDYVMKRIKEISELEKNPKVASDIVCNLVSRGAVSYDIDSILVIDRLEVEFKDHKTSMKRAYENYVNSTLEFMEIVKNAATGKVKDAKVDNSTLYLEYSEDMEQGI